MPQTEPETEPRTDPQAASPSDATAVPPTEPDAPCHTERLPSGFTAVVLPMPGLHQVQLSLFVPVGSRHERAEECGISHFVEHALFRGNALHPNGDALNRAFEGVGGMLNAHTGVESTEYDATVHPAHLDAALRALAAFIRTPVFAELEKERRILLDELSYDYNEEGRLVNVGTLSSQLLWPEHPLGQSVGGLPETIGALGVDAVRAHHARHYDPARMVLALAGAVEPEPALAAVRRHFGPWRPEPPTSASVQAPAQALPAPRAHGGGPRVKAVHDADNQLHLQLSFPAPGYNDPDELAMALLARVLDDGPTSRLQREIREERALVYHIAAGHSAYWDAGAFDVATSVKPDAFDELLDVLLRVLADVRDHGPAPEEVERARQRHLFDLEFDRDSPSARIARYAWPRLHATVRSEQAERDQVLALTPAALAALAGRLFTAGRAHAVLVGPVEPDMERHLRARLAAF